MKRLMWMIALFFLCAIPASAMEPGLVMIGEPLLYMPQVFQYAGDGEIQSISLNGSPLQVPLAAVRGERILLDASLFQKPGDYTVSVADKTGGVAEYSFSLADKTIIMRHNGQNTEKNGVWRQIDRKHGSSMELQAIAYAFTEDNLDQAQTAYFRFQNIPAGVYRIDFYKINQDLGTRLLPLSAEISADGQTELVENISIYPASAGEKGYEAISEAFYTIQTQGTVTFRIAEDARVNANSLFCVDSIRLVPAQGVEQKLSYFETGSFGISLLPAFSPFFAGDDLILQLFGKPPAGDFQAHVNGLPVDGRYQLAEERLIIDGRYFPTPGEYTVIIEGTGGIYAAVQVSAEAPPDTVSRGRFAQLAGRLLYDGIYPYQNCAKDVQETDQYANSIALLYDYGVAVAEFFCPGEVITREEAAVMLAKIFTARCGPIYAYGKETFLTDYFDIHPENRPWIGIAASIGGLTYSGQNLRFAPGAALTAQEAEIIVENVKKSIENFNRITGDAMIVSTAVRAGKDAGMDFYLAINQPGQWKGRRMCVVFAVKENGRLISCATSGYTVCPEQAFHVLHGYYRPQEIASGRLLECYVWDLDALRPVLDKHVYQFMF